ncbi:peptidase G1 [Boletus edulis]|nr:peptidase G1 [Boletus edulis]
MRLNSMLISSFFFASVALAGPSQFPRQSLVEKPAKASSETVTYTTDWAGAVYELDSGSLNSISGAVTVPHISGPINSKFSVSVNIDGTSCSSILGVAVEATVTASGPTYQALCYFNGSSDLNITISAGDLIRLTVRALDKTSGVMVVENLSNDQMDYRRLQSSDPLCERSAAWVVERLPSVDNTTLPFVNFSAVTFTEAVTLDNNSQSYGPQGANIDEILNEDGTIATSVTLGEFSVTIERV